MDFFPSLVAHLDKKKDAKKKLYASGAVEVTTDHQKVKMFEIDE